MSPGQSSLSPLPLFPPTDILPPRSLSTWEARQGAGDIILVFQGSRQRLEAQGGGLLPWCDETGRGSGQEGSCEDGG